MPLIQIKEISTGSHLGIWRIEEPEVFFLRKVPFFRIIHHPHKRLQHLAAWYLINEICPEFPMEKVRVFPNSKPVVSDQNWHFSISHSGDFAAVIVSRFFRVGIDIEYFNPRISNLALKFMTEVEQKVGKDIPSTIFYTLSWAAKEAVYKWYGQEKIIFRDHIEIGSFELELDGIIPCKFEFLGYKRKLEVHFYQEKDYCVAWVMTSF